MTDGLKPCPFCGGKATYAKAARGWKVECEGRMGSCKINARTHYQPHKFLAIAAWNTRADLATSLDDPRVKALVEAAKDVEGRFYQAAKMFHNTQSWGDEEQDGQPLDDWVFSPIRAALSALEENK